MEEINAYYRVRNSVHGTEEELSKLETFPIFDFFGDQIATSEISSEMVDRVYT